MTVLWINNCMNGLNEYMCVLCIRDDEDNAKNYNSTTRKPVARNDNLEGNIYVKQAAVWPERQ